ncbi:hypothetical protein NDU88_000437 [Pleurodeles waltl]|uniref:Reverse transcriptase domain-containing protein n=1 Tax=Pleurodeles waltl TaxID=8319 RepID=A0AAV7VWH9_PLEWA|nr:hypothetical protein NDU88_000437 [Pleurodeles waltl]
MEPFAEHIRQNQAIRDIPMGGRSHKIALYADDVLLYLTEVKISLVTVVNELRAFGEVAVFKTNLSKSSILNLTVMEKNVEDLRPHLPFVWAPQEIQYLG